MTRPPNPAIAAIAQELSAMAVGTTKEYPAESYDLLTRAMSALRLLGQGRWKRFKASETTLLVMRVQ